LDILDLQQVTITKDLASYMVGVVESYNDSTATLAGDDLIADDSTGTFPVTAMSSTEPVASANVPVLSSEIRSTPANVPVLSILLFAFKFVSIVVSEPTVVLPICSPPSTTTSPERSGTTRQ
jgi:hypothetical protein